MVVQWRLKRFYSDRATDVDLFDVKENQAKKYNGDIYNKGVIKLK